MKKLENEEEKRFNEWGQEEKGEEALRKPLPMREVQNGRNREMRKKNGNARKINRPRQLYQYKKLKKRANEGEKSYLLSIGFGSAKERTKNVERAFGEEGEQ